MSTAEIVVAVLFALFIIAGVWVSYGLTRDLRKAYVARRTP